MKVDCHCHILPGLDDGAQTLEESVFLASKLASWGYERVVCTSRDTLAAGRRIPAGAGASEAVSLPDDERLSAFEGFRKRKSYILDFIRYILENSTIQQISWLYKRISVDLRYGNTTKT